MYYKYDKKAPKELSRYFNSAELNCKCNSPDCRITFVHERLISILDEVRSYFNSPVRVNSGYRCINHNKAVGGSENSRHTHGEAADIIIDGVLPQQVYDFFNKRFPKELGLGNYKTFTHVDVREVKARF